MRAVYHMEPVQAGRQPTGVGLAEVLAISDFDNPGTEEGQANMNWDSLLGEWLWVFPVAAAVSFVLGPVTGIIAKYLAERYEDDMPPMVLVLILLASAVCFVTGVYFFLFMLVLAAVITAGNVLMVWFLLKLVWWFIQTVGCPMACLVAVLLLIVVALLTYIGNN